MRPCSPDPLSLVISTFKSAAILRATGVANTLPLFSTATAVFSKPSLELAMTSLETTTSPTTAAPFSSAACFFTSGFGASFFTSAFGASVTVAALLPESSIVTRVSPT